MIERGTQVTRLTGPRDAPAHIENIYACEKEKRKRYGLLAGFGLF